METFLNRLNLILVALLGGLIVYQWSGESRADEKIVDLRTNVRGLEHRLAEQVEALRRANEDIKDFKSVVANFKAKTDDDDAQIRKDKARIFVLERDATSHAAESESLKRSVAAYKEALAVRDADIRTLLDQRAKLVEAASDASHKAGTAVGLYNDLVAKYEGLVGKYNDLAKRFQAATAAANDNPKAPGDAHS
jgi:chromosome segregation ATPase